MNFERRDRFGSLCLTAAISVLLLSVILAPSNIYAGIASVSISPTTKSITILKGEERTAIFTVHNDSTEVQHVNVEPRQWFMIDRNKDIPLDSWLSISPAEFDIGPQEEKEVALKITVPEEAIGELAAMIAFKPRPKEGQAVNVIFSVSLYALIKNTEVVDCKISDFKLWKFEGRKALGAKVVLKNDGNIHLKPRISVFIQDIFKKKNLQKAVLRYGKPVYPGKGQGYEGAIYDFKLRPGVYRAVIDGEYTNVAKRFRRVVYFLVGWKGKVLYTFFRRER